jgi:molybdopterin-guanine dinucleotide biosynthesis protein A
VSVTAIILCGGQNRRFGRNKAVETVGGQTLIERVLDGLAPLTERALVVVSRAKVDLPVSGKAEVIPDLYPGAGPLGGIYTGLSSAQTPISIVVACDMPFLSTPLLRHMVEVSTGFSAVVPRLDGGLVEPLHALYNRNCLPKMKARLDRGELAITPLLKELRVRYVERDEYLNFDPEELSFFNINSPADLDRARLLAVSPQPRPESAPSLHNGMSPPGT